MESFFERLFQPEVVWVLIPVVAIAGAFGKQMLNRHYDHRERMARIEAGLDPDPDEEAD